MPAQELSPEQKAARQKIGEALVNGQQPSIEDVYAAYGSLEEFQKDIQSGHLKMVRDDLHMRGDPGRETNIDNWFKNTMNKWDVSKSQDARAAAVEEMKVSEEEKATMTDAMRRLIGSQGAENANRLNSVNAYNQASAGTQRSTQIGNALQTNKALALGEADMFRTFLGYDKAAAGAKAGFANEDVGFDRSRQMYEQQRQYLDQQAQASQPSFWDRAMGILQTGAAFIPGVGPAISAGIGIGNSVAGGGSAGSYSSQPYGNVPRNTGNGMAPQY